MKNNNAKPLAESTPLAPYKIITGVELTALEQRVNESIADGFQPVGSVNMLGNLLVQGMLKPAK